MTLYALALFLHIVGALGLFTALSLEWTSLRNLRRSITAEQAREWLTIFVWLRRLGPLSLAVLLIPGFYMMATVWRGVPWIGVALAALVLVAALGAVGGRRMAAVSQAVAAERGPLPAALQARLRDPFLWVSIQVRIAITLGNVFLMTAKPDLLGAFLTIGVAVLLGVAVALQGQRRALVETPVG